MVNNRNVKPACLWPEDGRNLPEPSLSAALSGTVVVLFTWFMSIGDKPLGLNLGGHVPVSWLFGRSAFVPKA